MVIVAAAAEVEPKQGRREPQGSSLTIFFLSLREVRAPARPLRGR